MNLHQGLDRPNQAIIENLRKLPKDYNSRDVEQIFRNIGYSKKSAENYGRIIQDMFFGMGIKESIFFS